MKIWRKSRLSECHANLFANGRVRAIYVNIFVMCAAMLSLDLSIWNSTMVNNLKSTMDAFLIVNRTNVYVSPDR